MAEKIVFDASVLISGYISGNLHKTGLFRVSHEILKQLVKSGSFEIYLFDVYHRERELIKYVQKEFKQCKRIKEHSYLFGLIVFSAGNFADYLRDIQKSTTSRIVSLLAGGLKNTLLIIEKGAGKADRLFFGSRKLNKSLNRCSLYFSTYYQIPLDIRENAGIKKVYTVHDLIPLIHPEYFSSPYNTILLKDVVDTIGKNDYVVCVSESTKRDLISFRPDLDLSHFIVAPLAAAEFFWPVKDEEILRAIKEKHKIPQDKKYLLSVCTFEPRKNLKTLIAAFRILLEQGNVEGTSLVLTGAPYWAKDPLLDEISIINKEYPGKILITGFVSDKELAVLYSGAYAFVYSSFYEGFGLPPLEAMQCGAPVICSETSSMPEVVGDCGILFNPFSVTELVNAITLLMLDKNLRNELAQKSLIGAASFNWSLTSSAIETVFNVALSEI